MTLTEPRVEPSVRPDDRCYASVHETLDPDSTMLLGKKLIVDHEAVWGPITVMLPAGAGWALWLGPQIVGTGLAHPDGKPMGIQDGWFTLALPDPMYLP